MSNNPTESPLTTAVTLLPPEHLELGQRALLALSSAEAPPDPKILEELVRARRCLRQMGLVDPFDSGQGEAPAEDLVSIQSLQLLIDALRQRMPTQTSVGSRSPIYGVDMY